MSPTVASLLLPPAAGAARCFACGWLVAGSAQAARRAGLSTTLSLAGVRPVALGAALATLCAAWHAAMLAFRALGRPREPSSRSAVAGAIAGALVCSCRPHETGMGSDVHAAVVLSAARTYASPGRGSRRQRARAALAVAGVAGASSWWSLHCYARAALAAAQHSAVAAAAATAASPAVAADATDAAVTAALQGAGRASLSAATTSASALVVVADLETTALALLRSEPPPLRSFWLPLIAVQGAVRACDPSRGPPTVLSLVIACVAGWADGTRAELCRTLPASVVMVRLALFPYCLAFKRYSFTSRRLCTNQSSFQSPRPLALHTLLQYAYTIIGQYTTPLRPPFCIPYTMQYWQ